jgi:hypothetical protein
MNSQLRHGFIRRGHSIYDLRQYLWGKAYVVQGESEVKGTSRIWQRACSDHKYHNQLFKLRTKLTGIFLL